MVSRAAESDVVNGVLEIAREVHEVDLFNMAELPPEQLAISIREELDSLASFGVYEPVNRGDVGQQVLSCKWVHRQKGPDRT